MFIFGVSPDFGLFLFKASSKNHTSWLIEEVFQCNSKIKVGEVLRLPNVNIENNPREIIKVWFSKEIEILRMI